MHKEAPEAATEGAEDSAVMEAGDRLPAGRELTLNREDKTWEQLQEK